MVSCSADADLDVASFRGREIDGRFSINAKLVNVTSREGRAPLHLLRGNVDRSQS